jgi:hypothetical protein
MGIYVARYVIDEQPSIFYNMNEMNRANNRREKWLPAYSQLHGAEFFLKS